MHFRPRGNTIQLVRTAYDAEKKGAKSEVVGRIPKRATEVPEELKAKLTAEELAACTTYLDQVKAIEELQLKVTALTLRQTVAQAIEYAEGVTDEAERDQLKAIFAESVLALRRASNPKSAEERRAAKGGGGKGGKRRRDEEASSAAA
ncbi:MAG: hypothetical protein K2X49_24650 [Acetobacteraceae bacterium]|nr:hypothetical protein [Acetobacteraceae bacterium]